MSYPDFSELVWTELGRMIVGRKIGNGVYRKVYRHRHDDSLVIKIENGGSNFCNVKEWEIWKEVEDEPFSKWFAPCEYISPCGLVLMQKKTIAAPARNMPKKVPTMFRDLKTANWGMYQGRAVCHDYGNNALTTGGRKLKNVNWYD